MFLSDLFTKIASPIPIKMTGQNNVPTTDPSRISRVISCRRTPTPMVKSGQTGCSRFSKRFLSPSIITKLGQKSQRFGMSMTRMLSRRMLTPMSRKMSPKITRVMVVVLVYNLKLSAKSPMIGSFSCRPPMAFPTPMKNITMTAIVPMT